MTNTFQENGTTYSTSKFTIGKTEYTVLVVKGKYNYITVKKPSPWKTLGKQFENFDQAISHYKNAQIKVELLKIELGL